MNSPNYFDLEEQIMRAWTTCDDIEVMLKALDRVTPMSEDELSNLLIGIKAMHQLRCEQLFDTFESLVRQRKL